MNQIKAVFATVLFVLVMLLAVQNVDLLVRPVTVGLAWPRSLAFVLEFPLYALIVLIFLVGFGLVSLFSLREHLGRRKVLLDTLKKIKMLEQELKPRSGEGQAFATAVFESRDAAHETQEPLQSETEQAMDSPETTPVTDSPASRTQIKDDEILIRPSAPGWGAVLLLTAALALVFSGGVYILLDERVSELTSQMDHLTGQTGHLSSAQQELTRTWEQERATVREEMGTLNQSHAVLLEEMGRLEQQLQALSQLPGEVRKRLIAGFLRDTAGRAAFLGTQMEDEAQRDILDGIHERLQDLASELEGPADRTGKQE
ncbi:MAG TPA: LapA family protein [Desulfonatronum sp.]|nr:LapA family protein [Desulfonatronum sp.]